MKSGNILDNHRGSVIWFGITVLSSKRARPVPWQSGRLGRDGASLAAALEPQLVLGQGTCLPTCLPARPLQLSPSRRRRTPPPGSVRRTRVIEPTSAPHEAGAGVVRPAG